MQVRKTVRLLLLDPEGRVLLTQFDDPSLSETDGAGPRVFWATIGGRMEGGEDVMATAAREAFEETGQTNIEIGPVVWYGEQTLLVNDEPTYFKETFVVARTQDTALSDEHWTEDERLLVKDMRWLSIEDLKSTSETVFPETLPDLLPDIIAGRYPHSVLAIEL